MVVEIFINRIINIRIVIIRARQVGVEQRARAGHGSGIGGDIRIPALRKCIRPIDTQANKCHYDHQDKRKQHDRLTLPVLRIA
jgi:hypothetical protein